MSLPARFSNIDEDYQYDLLAAGILLLVIAEIWLIDWFPFQDYYEWLLQGKILYGLWQGDGAIEALYQAHWWPLPPNTLTTVCTALLHYLLPTEDAGRLYLSLEVLLYSAAIYYLCLRTDNRHHPLRHMGLFLVFNYFFFSGYSGYVLGMAVLFFCLTLFSGPTQQPSRHALKVGAVALLLYSIHGFPFGLFLIATALWLFREYRQRESSVELRRYALALLPALALLWIYLAYIPRPADAPAMTFFEEMWPLVQSLRYGLSALPRIPMVTALYPLSLVNILYLVFWAALLWGLRRHFRFDSFFAWLALLAVAAALLNPIYRIGFFYPPNPRFIPLIFASACAAIVVRRPHRPVTIAILTAAFIFTLMNMLHVMTFDQQNRAALAELAPVYRAAETPLVLGKFGAEEFDKSPQHIFSAVIQPYMRVGYKLNTDTLRHFLPIHPIGVVRVKAADSVQAIVRADSLFDLMLFRRDLSAMLAAEKGAVATTFDYIFVAGSSAIGNTVHDILAPFYVHYLSNPRWTILRRVAPRAQPRPLSGDPREAETDATSDSIRTVRIPI